MRRVKRERIFKGIITLMILKALWDSPKHGYLLENEISNMIGDRLSEGEIYSLLKHMELRGFVSSKSEVCNNRLRKYYEITPKGREFFLKHKAPIAIMIPMIMELKKFMDSLDSTDELNNKNQ
jgi:Predicted transcriptional regulators